MVQFSSFDPGTPCWVDLMSPDVDASKAFYTAVFGWETDDQFDDNGNLIYTNLQLGGKNVAGLGGQMGETEGMPPVWNTYIAVDDCDEAAAKVTAAGGTVMMPPMEVMTAGAMAVFADPTGAVFSVWKAGDHRGASICNEPNTFAWNELVSRDIETAKSFYTDVFGWKYQAQDMGPMGTYTTIEGGENGGLGGMMPMPAEMPEQVPNHWMVYFSVADIGATKDAVTANGGQIVQGPMPIPGVGTLAVIHDPNGGSFSVLQPEG
jgi:predicted enzyme related to lactoylglutathione lyase